MTLRNPHLKDIVKNRPSNFSLEHKGYSFDYWAKQAHKAGPGKAQIAKKWLKRAVLLGVLLVVFAIISVFAMRSQDNMLASFDCDTSKAQKASNSMLAFGGCKKIR